MDTELVIVLIRQNKSIVQQTSLLLCLTVQSSPGRQMFGKIILKVFMQWLELFGPEIIYQPKQRRTNFFVQFAMSIVTPKVASGIICRARGTKKKKPTFLKHDESTEDILKFEEEKKKIEIAMIS